MPEPLTVSLDAVAQQPVDAGAAAQNQPKVAANSTTNFSSEAAVTDFSTEGLELSSPEVTQVQTAPRSDNPQQESESDRSNANSDFQFDQGQRLAPQEGGKIQSFENNVEANGPSRTGVDVVDGKAVFTVVDSEGNEHHIPDPKKTKAQEHIQEVLDRSQQASNSGLPAEQSSSPVVDLQV